MADRYTIEVRLTGDLTPDKIRSQDIAILISAIEQMVAVIVARDNPALGIEESQVTVGLSAVGQSSYIMQFDTQYQNEVQRAYEIVTNAIAAQSFDALPIRSLEAIRRIRNIARDYRTETLFGYANDDFVHLATVSANTAIDVSPPELTGSTTLYGILTGIGGVNPPSARLTLLNGTRINCNVTERDNLAVARDLGKRLYTEIGVKGEARWDVRDMSLTFFRIDELLEYEAKPITQALDRLYEGVGKYWEAVSSTEAFIADIRGNDGID